MKVNIILDWEMTDGKRTESGKETMAENLELMDAVIILDELRPNTNDDLHFEYMVMNPTLYAVSMKEFHYTSIELGTEYIERFRIEEVIL